MAETVYFLCALMSIACAFFLIRSHAANGSRLLLWSGVCFALLALNNTILVVDLVIIPEVEFNGTLWRNGIGATAGCAMLFGLIWELT